MTGGCKKRKHAVYLGTRELCLLIFDRKILTKIFGPTKNVNSLWRVKTNEELDVLIERINIMRFITAQRLKWLGHVERMPDEREVTRIYKWKPLASRPNGRRKNRWEGDVRMDLQEMKINTFIAIVDLSRFNNSCLKSPASTLVDLGLSQTAHSPSKHKDKHGFIITQCKHTEL